MSETIMIEDQDQGPAGQDLKTAESNAAAALEAATVTRDDARQQMVDLEAKLQDAIARAAAAQAKREELALATSQGDTGAKRGLTKHTREKQEADDEASTLELAIHAAERRAVETDKAWYEAEADHQWAQAQVHMADLRRVSAQIDAHLNDGADMIAERERLLRALQQCGVLRGDARAAAMISVQTLGEMFSKIAQAPDTHPMLKNALADTRAMFPFAKTLLQKDTALMNGLRRPNAARRWEAAQPTAAPGSGGPEASGMGHGFGAVQRGEGRGQRHVTEDGVERNPLTGARIIRHDYGQQANDDGDGDGGDKGADGET